MPSPRRRGPDRRCDLDDAVRLFLERGPSWSFFVELSDEQAQSLWAAHRDTLLAEWIERRPGTRPHAWWRFEAREPRKAVDGMPHPFANEARGKIVGGLDLEFGMPNCWLPDGNWGRKFETQKEYLTRLGLLTEAEKGR